MKLKFYFVNMSNSLITASASQKIVKYLSCYQTYCKLCFGALATWKPPSAYYLQLKHSVEILKAKFIQMTLVRIVIHCLQLEVFISIDTIPGVFISIDTIPSKRNALSITCAKSVWPLKSTVFLGTLKCLFTLLYRVYVINRYNLGWLSSVNSILYSLFPNCLVFQSPFHG